MTDTGYSSVLRESSAQRDGLFGTLTLIWVVGLVRGVVGASTVGGRSAAAAIFGLLTVGTVLVWITRLRRAPWLEIADDHIELLRPNATDSIRLTRTEGDRLQFVTVGSARSRHTALTIPGSSTRLDLQFFAKKRVQAACVEHGWRFD